MRQRGVALCDNSLFLKGKYAIQAGRWEAPRKAWPPFAPLSKNPAWLLH